MEEITAYFLPGKRMNDQLPNSFRQAGYTNSQLLYFTLIIKSIPWETNKIVSSLICCI